MGKALVELFQKLVESPISLIIILGFLLFMFGLSGGVAYHDWLPIAFGWQQIVAITVGVLLLIVGILLVWSKPLTPRPYGISITSPTINERVAVTKVEGKIRKRPPPKYELWLLGIYRDDTVYPARRVNLIPGQETWSVADYDIGGSSGERRVIGAFLVGPAGQALFAYFLAAARRHNRWMDKLEVPADERERYLPNIERDLIGKADMIECDRVEVFRD